MTDSKRMLLPQLIAQALLSGATQVSVPVKPQPWCNKWGTWMWKPDRAWWKQNPQYFVSGSSPEELARCMLLPRPAIIPLGDIGTRVWVPETWMVYDVQMDPHTWKPDGYRLTYPTREGVSQLTPWLHDPRAFPALATHYKAEGLWRSPATMPSWAARLRFTVESVSVGREGNEWRYAYGLREE